MSDADDQTPEELLASLRAMMDQAVATAPETARLARALYDAFRAEGFSDSQALYLALGQMVQNPGRTP